MHPNRSLFGRGRSWRKVRDRENGELLNRSFDVECEIGTMWWRNVSHSETQYVVGVERETRTWVIPVLMLPGDFVPESGKSVRASDRKLWLILNAKMRDNQQMWECVCVESPEH